MEGRVRSAAVSVTGMTGAATMAAYRLDGISVDGLTIRNVEVNGLPDRKYAAITAVVTGDDLTDGSIATFD